jgi:hypothetical protein
MPEHVLQSPDTHKRGDSSKDLLPWEEGWVRAEVVKVFNLRLPEPYKLKLDWLRAQTRVPTHELLLGLVLPGIDREIVRVRTQSDQRKKLPSSSSHE